MTKLYGAIEAGGTKFVCAVADENLNIVERVSIPTTVPEETMSDIDYCANALETTRSEVVRKGIALVKDQINK